MEKIEYYTPTEVTKITSLSHMTIARLVKEGSFPEPIQLTEKRKGFPKHEVDQWTIQQFIKSRKG